MGQAHFERIIALARQAGVTIAWHAQPGQGLLTDSSQGVVFLPQQADDDVVWRLLGDALRRYGLEALVASGQREEAGPADVPLSTATTEVSNVLASALLDDCAETLRAGSLVVSRGVHGEPKKTIRIRPGRLPVKVPSLGRAPRNPTLRDIPHVGFQTQNPTHSTPPRAPDATAQTQDAPAAKASPPPIPVSTAKQRGAPGLAFGAPTCELCEGPRYALIRGLALCRHHLNLSVRGALSPSEVRAIRRRHGVHAEVPFERYDDRGRSRTPGAW